MAFDPRTQVPAIHVVWADDPSWTHPADGATVDAWRNHSGGSLAQTDPVKRPIFVASEASARGHAVVRFDGVDDYLTLDVADIPQPYKVVVAAAAKGTALEKIVGFGDSAARGLGHSGGAKWQLNAGVGQQSVVASDALGHTLRATVSGAASAVWVDGEQVIAGDVGAMAMYRLSVGAGVSTIGSTVTAPLRGDVAFVGVYSADKSDADLAQLADDLWHYYYAPLIPWTPGMPWPGSEGGALSPRWGGYVRLFVRAAIATGSTFHVGQHAYDQLDAGNVLGGEPVAGTLAGPARLWVDLTCDVESLKLEHGASSSAGIFTKADAATAEVVLSDPDGIYDPATVQQPFAYGGRSRLVPGIPVEVFAEVVDPFPEGSVTTHYLFTGTADSWREDWTTQRSSRRAVLVASDATKTWVRYDRPEQPAIGVGDTTAARVQRLVTYFGWQGTIIPGATNAAQFSATTLAQSGWELLGRTMDEELGVAYFTTTGELRWTSRADWFTEPVPFLGLGCPDLEPMDPALHDVLIDASPSSNDVHIRNVIRASRPGGSLVTVTEQASFDAYGAYEYQRTDLGLTADSGVTSWANAVLLASAWPRITLDDVTMVPAVDPASWELWPLVLDVDYVTDAVRVVWAPPDRPEAIVDQTARVVGASHQITRSDWTVKWQLASLAMSPTPSALPVAELVDA